MQPPDPQAVFRLLFLVVLAVWASVAVGSWMATRWLHGQRVLAYEPRRPVPWNGRHVALLALVFWAAPQVAALGTLWAFDVPLPRASDDGPPRQDRGHVIQQILSRDDRVAVVALAVAATVVVAPVVEELMFRVVLQGWLEKAERRFRRRTRVRRWAGVAPVAASSLLFAAMHFRGPAREVETDLLVFLLGCHMVGSLVTAAVTVLVLKLHAGATAADLGFSRAHLAGDVARGLVAWAAVTGPVYVLMILTKLAVGEQFAPDPVPLFFLALVLGVLYLRTHRIVPAIVLHVAFNATGLALFALAQ